MQGPKTSMIVFDREGAFAQVAEGVPQGRVADPPKIIGVCTFLASDDTSFMRGLVLAVDEGSTIVHDGMIAFGG
jgi:NAD(P)-dependent dehydrogenase (short-subunit alcohol dehydrogenase family)